MVKGLILEEVPKQASSLSNLSNNSTYALQELFLIGRTLDKILSSLKDSGDVWLGITKLVGGWSVQADNSFKKFDLDLHSMSQNKEIAICRLYWVPSETHLEGARPTIEEHQRQGVIARLLVGGNPPDISLIWAGAENLLSLLPKLRTAEDPVKVLKQEGLSAVCGMSFNTVGGNRIDEMKIAGRITPAFEQMQAGFTRFWDIE